MSLKRQLATEATPNTLSILRKVVIHPLMGSENPSDRRKGRDIQQLVNYQQCDWSGRMTVLGVQPGPRRTLDVLVAIRAAGLIWDGAVEPCDTFHVMLGIANNYPMAPPPVVFVKGPTPYHPNVLHRDFLPDTRGLPPELQQMANDNQAGACCYSMPSEWTPDLDHSLATVVRHVSRVLVGAKFRGEKHALNTQARDHYLTLKEQGRLPLGPALPLPDEPGNLAAHVGSDEEADGEAIEWIEEPSASGDGS